MMADASSESIQATNENERRKKRTDRWEAEGEWTCQIGSSVGIARRRGRRVGVGDGVEVVSR